MKPTPRPLPLPLSNISSNSNMYSNPGRCSWASSPTCRSEVIRLTPPLNFSTCSSPVRFFASSRVAIWSGRFPNTCSRYRSNRSLRVVSVRSVSAITMSCARDGMHHRRMTMPKRNNLHCFMRLSLRLFCLFLFFRNRSACLRLGSCCRSRIARFSQGGSP